MINKIDQYKLIYYQNFSQFFIRMNFMIQLIISDKPVRLRKNNSISNFDHIHKIFNIIQIFLFKHPNYFLQIVLKI